MKDANENEGPSAPPAVMGDAGLQPDNRTPRAVGRPWAKGVSGNPSGKRRGTVSLRAAAQRVVSRRDAEEICRKLVAAAKDGNLKAVKLLAELLGDIGAASLAIGQPEVPRMVVVKVVDVAAPQPRASELPP